MEERKQKYVDILNNIGFSIEKKEQYDKDMYDEKRQNGELAAARSDRRAEAEVEMAKKLKVLGIDINTMVQATGLNREAVEKL